MHIMKCGSVNASLLLPSSTSTSMCVCVHVRLNYVSTLRNLVKPLGEINVSYIQVKLYLLINIARRV